MWVPCLQLTFDWSHHLYHPIPHGWLGWLAGFLTGCLVALFAAIISQQSRPPGLLRFRPTANADNEKLVAKSSYSAEWFFVAESHGLISLLESSYCSDFYPAVVSMRSSLTWIARKEENRNLVNVRARIRNGQKERVLQEKKQAHVEMDKCENIEN